MTNVTKLNALRRLTMKVHGESPAPRKRKEWRIRLYDGDRVNVEIAKVNATVIEGPPTRLGTLNVDKVVTRWRRTGSANAQ